MFYCYIIVISAFATATKCLWAFPRGSSSAYTIFPFSFFPFYGVFNNRLRFMANLMLTSLEHSFIDFVIEIRNWIYNIEVVASVLQPVPHATTWEPEAHLTACLFYGNTKNPRHWHRKKESRKESLQLVNTIFMANMKTTCGRHALSCPMMHAMQGLWKLDNLACSPLCCMSSL